MTKEDAAANVQIQNLLMQACALARMHDNAAQSDIENAISTTRAINDSYLGVDPLESVHA